jgi:hypothetical protein
LDWEVGLGSSLGVDIARRKVNIIPGGNDDGQLAKYIGENSMCFLDIAGN